jgi:hypothetical protein
MEEIHYQSIKDRTIQALYIQAYGLRRSPRLMVVGVVVWIVYRGAERKIEFRR